MRKAAAMVAAGMTVLGLAFAGTAMADDRHDKRDEVEKCEFGAAVGDGAAIGNTFRFDLCRTGPATTDVTGFFATEGRPPSDVLIAPRGPITCAEFRGNAVGFVYPLIEGSRPAPLANTTEILITATDGGPGGVDTIVFTGPVPVGTFGANCAPTLAGAPQPVIEGDIVVDARD